MVPAAVDVTTILFPLTTLLPLTILFLMFFLLPLRALPQPVATSNLPPILFQLDSSESALGHSKSAEQCIFIARQGGSEKQSSHPLVVAVVSLVVLLAALANPAAPAAVRERSRPLVVAVVSVVVLLAALANPAAPAALRERSRPLVVAVVNLVVLLAGLADPAAATAAQERSRLVVVAMVSPRELPEMWRFNQVLVVVQGLLMEFLMVWTGSCSLGRLAFLLHPLLRMAPVVLLELVPPATSQALIAVCLVARRVRQTQPTWTGLCLLGSYILCLRRTVTVGRRESAGPVVRNLLMKAKVLGEGLLRKAVALMGRAAAWVMEDPPIMMTFMSQGDGEICYHHRDEGLASG
ncbi:hypothetical protein I4F81_011489 [Pyropia yezoensis]|uniref:Uncharacterized protein n=1 Tax=Pyropia yezoensis TaxID=2788 RepID=A0ACC3CGX3_PYRYE|nr:hypothetical protein I4F81_011489 [Neopyropia yezoensis]